MKQTIIFLICLVAIVTATPAQTKIKANDIIQQINEGRDVALTNVEIEGKLDLTDLASRMAKHTEHENDRFVSAVKVSLSFTGCTFSGDVLAYYNNRCTEQTFTANFEKGVLFKNCVFKQASEFKYSEFAQAASFSGSVFSEEANFKYAEFANGPSFDNVTFESGGNFKYTEFPRETTFQRAIFNDMADFKYSRFASPVNLEGVAFNGHGEFKYTRIDGKSFVHRLQD